MKIYYTYDKKEIEEIVDILKKVQDFCSSKDPITIEACKISLERASDLLLVESDNWKCDYDLD